VVGNPGRYAFGSGKKKRTAKKTFAKRRQSNPGSIVGFTLGNPGRKGAHSMAKTKRKSTSKSHAKRGYSKSKRSNPGRRHHHTAARHHRRRYNPGTLSGIGPLVTNAVFVIIGALGSKLGAQAVLGSNNTGLVGYAGNAAAGAVLWFLAEKVMKNRSASSGILAGTAVQIVLRLINDYTPFGSYVASLGMGDYQMQSFVTPQVLVDPLNSAGIQIPSGWGAPATGLMPAGTPMPAGGGAAAGVGALYGHGGGSLY
jgi:hypothetical protein